MKDRKQGIHWRPGIGIAILGASVFAAIRVLDVWPYEQARTMALLATVAGTALLLLVWWLFFPVHRCARDSHRSPCARCFRCCSGIVG